MMLAILGLRLIVTKCIRLRLLILPMVTTTSVLLLNFKNISNFVAMVNISSVSLYLLVGRNHRTILSVL